MVGVRAAVRGIGRHPLAYLIALTAIECVLAVIVRPLVGGALSFAMTAAGIPGLSLGTLARVLTAPLALVVLIAVALVVVAIYWLALAVFIALAVEARSPQPIRGRAVITGWRRTVRRVRWRRGVLLLLAGVALLPVVHVVSRALIGEPFIVPDFLLTAVLGSPVAMVILLLVVLAPFVALVVRDPRVLLVIAGTAVVAVLAAAGLALLALLIPGPFGFVLARILVALCLGLGVAVVAGAVVPTRRIGRAPAGRTPRVPLGLQMVLAFLLSAAVTATVAMQWGVAVGETNADPHLIVAGHRGNTVGAVENTVQALDTARAVGADQAELDVQETSDGQFVVFHDVDLLRLAGIDRRVGDMTLAELTATTITENGRSTTISSLQEILERGRDLGLRLLLEVKLHGGESEGYLPRELDQILSVLTVEQFEIQSLDAGVLTETKRLHPDIRTGFLISRFTGHLPATDADFILLDSTSYTDAIAAEARAVGKPLWVWLADSDAQLEYFARRDIAGVVTNDVPRGLDARARQAAERGPVPRWIGLLIGTG